MMHIFNVDGYANYSSVVSIYTVASYVSDGLFPTLFPREDVIQEIIFQYCFNVKSSFYE